MPVSGKVSALDVKEIRVAGSASGSHSGDGTGVYTWSGSGVTYYTPDATNLEIGFLIQIGGSSATGNWSVTYTGPGSPLGTTWNGSGWTSAECVIELTNERLYDTGSGWVYSASYEVFAGGVSRLTGSISESISALGPSYVPLIGIPISLAGSGSASTTGLPTYTQTSTYDYQSTVTGTVTGGWRQKEVGSAVWETMPVRLISLSVPSVACDFSSSLPAVAASSTYGLSVPFQGYSRTKRTQVADDEAGQINVVVSCAEDEFNPAYEICNETGPLEVGSGDPTRDVYSLENWGEPKSGSVCALPDLEKAIKRFNEDFKMTLQRYEMPQVVARRTASCTTNGVTVSDTSDEEVYPYQDYIMQLVENAAAAMEDTLGYPTYAPVTANAGYTYTKVHQYYENFTGVLCPPLWFSCDTSGCTTTTVTECDVIWPEYEDEDVSYSASVTFPYSVGPSADMVGYLGHAEPLARYMNSWPNPHWSYFMRTESWEVDSSPETWADYWEKIGSQYNYNAAASITDRTRNHLVSEPLGNDGHSGFLNSFAAGQRWPGISRWITKEITPLSSYTFTSASSSLWAGTDCTISHGADMTVNPSASPCEVALTLGSFTVEPYQWVHLADRITVDRTAANITDFKVYLEAVDGTRVLLNDNEPGTAKYRPQVHPGKYAGSWKQDFGAGVVTDEGSDDTVDGISSATMADAERAFAFQLLADFTAAKLVYVVEVADVDVDFNLDYPEFEYTKSNTRLLTPENAHQVNIVHSEGPGVRFGFWDTGTSGTVNNPPAVYDPSERPNTVDWLVAERLAVRGVAYNDGLTTELTSLRNTFEGQSVGNERTSSYGFWLVPEPASTDWYLALVSSLAECPPLACFPRKERVKTDWSETGADYVQHSWVWAQGPDYLVSAATASQIAFSSSQWTSGASGIPGWQRSKHSHEVDNTETGAKVTTVAGEIATVRPWRGFFVVPIVSDSAGVALAVRSDWYLVCGRIESGEVVLNFAFAGRAWGPDVPTGVEADQVSLAWAPGQDSPLCMVTAKSGSAVVYRTSTDGGTSWSLPLPINSTTTASQTAIAVTPDGTRFIYWVDAGKVRGSIYDGGMTAIGATEFESQASADDAGFGVAASRIAGGQVQIEMVHVDGGAVEHTVSTDGRSFS